MARRLVTSSITSGDYNDVILVTSQTSTILVTHLSTRYRPS